MVMRSVPCLFELLFGAAFIGSSGAASFSIPLSTVSPSIAGLSTFSETALSSLEWDWSVVLAILAHGSAGGTLYRCVMCTSSSSFYHLKMQMCHVYVEIPDHTYQIAQGCVNVYMCSDLFAMFVTWIFVNY